MIARFFIHSFSLFLLSCVILMGTQSSYAELLDDASPSKTSTSDSDDIVAENVLEVNFSDIEGLGLFGTTKNGGLGKSLWKYSERSSILHLLENMPATSETPEVNAMIFGILLTETNPRLIEDNVPIENGKDLLTLRIEKLLEGGAYKAAFELYSQLETEAYHERLARAGVLSMLFSGDKSLACLETNILFERFKGHKFWQTLSAYCDVSLSEESEEEDLAVLEAFSSNKILKNLSTDKDYRFIYTDKAYGRLTTLERALLAAEERLDVSNASIADLDQAPAGHVLPLLGVPTLSKHERFILSLRAVKLGLLDDGALVTIYKDKDIDGDSDADQSWTQLPATYRAVENISDNAEQWEVLRKALPLLDKFGPTALLPYAKITQRIKPINATLNETFAAYRVLQRAGIKIPDHWVDAYNDIPFDGEHALHHARILTVNAITSSSQKKNQEKFERVFAALQTENPKESLLLQRILSKLDNLSAKNYTQNNIYEKEFYLTRAQDYVMQSSVVWDRLLKTSNAKAIGETVLLNIILLHEQNLQNVYPRLFGDIMQSTENVGLTSISKSLAIKASLGD